MFNAGIDTFRASALLCVLVSFNLGATAERRAQNLNCVDTNFAFMGDDHIIGVSKSRYHVAKIDAQQRMLSFEPRQIAQSIASPIYQFGEREIAFRVTSGAQFAIFNSAKLDDPMIVGFPGFIAPENSVIGEMKSSTVRFAGLDVPVSIGEPSADYLAWKHNLSLVLTPLSDMPIGNGFAGLLLANTEQGGTDAHILDLRTGIIEFEYMQEGKVISLVFDNQGRPILRQIVDSVSNSVLLQTRHGDTWRTELDLQGRVFRQISQSSDVLWFTISDFHEGTKLYRLSSGRLNLAHEYWGSDNSIEYSFSPDMTELHWTIDFGDGEPNLEFHSLGAEDLYEEIRLRMDTYTTIHSWSLGADPSAIVSDISHRGPLTYRLIGPFVDGDRRASVALCQ